MLRQIQAGGGVSGWVLTGMGGVGKTQLAADHARTLWADGTLDVLVWITASTRSAVMSGYAQAGAELCRADPDDPEQAALAFLAWLTPKAAARPCRWLIVLDDIAEPDDLRGLWPPASEHGRTLATTRRRDAALIGEGRHLIEVALFTQEEALAYLTSALALHGRHEPEAEITALAVDLGCLPLALSQAAAYLIDSGAGAAAYRRLLADRTTPLIDAAPDPLPDDQVLPLAAAWSLSIDRADRLHPAGLARPMLHLTALLDANGIAEDVLTSPPARAYLTAHRTRTGQDPAEKQEQVTPRDVARTLRVLHRLHLIDHTSAAPHQAVRVHQLVQRATRDTLTRSQRDRLARTTADALLAAWPDVEPNTSLGQTLRANTTALVSHSEDALYESNAHAVLHRTGKSLGDAGQFSAARDYFDHLVQTATRRLGPDCPDTLWARTNLALWQGRAGDTAGAVAAMEELLEYVVRVLGADDPITFSTRHHLAWCQAEAGDAAGAVAAMEAMLADQRRVLSEDDFDTLVARQHLAMWQGEAGDAAGAATTFAEVLAAEVRVLGVDHRNILLTRYNLALWRVRAGVVDAMEELEEVLADWGQLLGDDHPHTLGARGNFALWRGQAGDAVGAAVTLEELLERAVRVLGDDHTITLTTRHQLDWCRREAEKRARLPGNDRS